MGSVPPTSTKYCGSTLKYGKEINATIATPLRVAFISFRNQANLDSRKIMRALSEVAFIYYRISALSQKLAFFSVRILKLIHSTLGTQSFSNVFRYIMKLAECMQKGGAESLIFLCILVNLIFSP